ncbi:MAG: hypothetical protein QOK14_1235, partial [Frankiaceae bacterium]|nr:hypothetical protein [Frankiaceae bacterium]
MNLVAAAAAAAAAAGWFAAPPSARVRLDAVRSGSPARTAGSRLADVRFLVTAGAVATTALAPGTALLIALAAVGAHHALRRRSAEVRRSRVVAALPAVCDDLSRLLLSGESPVGALRAAADAAPPELAARLREAAATGQLGGSPADALGRPGPYAAVLSPLA